MKEITLQATIAVDEDALNEVLEQYRNTKTGELDTVKALEHILNNGLGNVSVSFSGDMRKISHDVTVDDLSIFEMEKGQRFLKKIELLATS